MLQSQTPVRRWKQWLALPLVAGLCAVVGQPASAQTAPPPPPPPPRLLPAAQAKIIDGKKVYVYVDEMPALPGAAGMEPIVKKILDNFVRPAGPHQEGRIFASFIVGAGGEVRGAKIEKGLTPAYDEAVLAAIQKLPRFIPGKQSGQAVDVGFTVPILFKDNP